MTSLLALHCFTNYFGTCLGGVLLALLRLANFGTCVGCRRRLLALHCLANFGTCLGGVLRALLFLPFLPFFASLILAHVSAEGFLPNFP